MSAIVKTRGTDQPIRAGIPVRRLVGALVGALLILGGLTGTAALAAPGEDDTPIDNPDLVTSCGIDIDVILDESGSVQPVTDDVRRAFKAFTSALNNTGSRIAVSEFSTVARLPLPGAASRSYTVVTDDTIRDIFNPYINNNYNPNGKTHWEDAFRASRYFQPRPSPDTPHLVVFITDGDPNEVVRYDRVTYDPGNTNQAQNEYERKIPLDEANEVTSASSNDAKNRAVSNANALKADGSHILTIAVGSGLNNPDSLARIIDVSGPNVFDGNGTFDISSDDVYRVPDFGNLEAALRQAAFQLCAPSITVRKLIDLTPNPGSNDLLPGEGWDLTAVADPTPADWVLPPTGTGDTATATTDPAGFASFQWTTSTPRDSDVEIKEQSARTVPPGFENDPSATSCTFRTPDQPDDRPLDVDAFDEGFRATLRDDSITTCRMVNRLLPDPDIDIEKFTGGSDADAPPGPFIPVRAPNGDRTAVLWTYEVTNTGNVRLSDIRVTDNKGVDVKCPERSLGPGLSMTCTASRDAAAGQYANVGSVTGTDPFGTRVRDVDPSHYFGSASGIDVEKSTNGRDADRVPGPIVSAGAPVTWHYVITNTGNTSLTDVALDDDRLGDIDCPVDTLAPDEKTTCIASGIAQPGQYENVATASGDDGSGPTARDSDPSHYFGQDASVQLEKFTNEEDADDPPGPLVPVGGRVVWIYRVTNTGNVPLRQWKVTDDPAQTIRCPDLVLIPVGQSVFCFARLSGGARVGQYANTARVVAKGLSDATVTDSDPSHYFGGDGAIDLQKLTNGLDADDPPGPFIPVGGPVAWTYRVTNTGNVDLSNLEVVDSRGIAVGCPTTSLAPGASIDCSGSGLAQPDQYHNLARATALTSFGDVVDAVDPSHYFGATSAISLEKSTNGVDADDPPGPFIPAGRTVTWSYVVTNTGNSQLTGLDVTDDRGVVVSCPTTVLNPGEAVTCTATAAAEDGEYANNATATATGATGEVSDVDPSHYFGAVSKIHIEKATNGHDADDPPGPRIPEGNPVTWTYQVTNPGNMAIRKVRVKDDRGEKPRYAGGDENGDHALDPSETWTYTATGKAKPGQYRNKGTVTGINELETKLADSDPSHYYFPVQKPKLVIHKSASKAKVRPGGVIGYTISVRDAGKGDASHVHVCDTLPPEQHLLSNSPRAQHTTDRTACWLVPLLRSGASRTFRVVAQVDELSPPGRQRDVAVIKSKRSRRKTDDADVKVVSAGGGPCRARRSSGSDRRPWTALGPVELIAPRC